MSRKIECSTCGLRPHRPGQRDCAECHAAAQRKHRAEHPLKPEPKRKDCCRSFAHVYRNRGAVKKWPCIFCGNKKSQMHHPDYERPLLIIWMCRDCHVDLHDWDEKQALRRVLRRQVEEMAVPGWRSRTLIGEGRDQDLRKIFSLAVNVQRTQPGVPVDLPVGRIASLMGIYPDKFTRYRDKLVGLGALVRASYYEPDSFFVQENVQVNGF
jgi:hypothetical protein